MWSREELARGFVELGVTSGDVVMLHASVRSVGEVAGGPDQIHIALRDVLGPGGTLMMYVGCPSYYDDVGRGVLTAAQEQEVLAKHPPFDPLTTRSARSHGILVEFFRTFPGTTVNNHIARFAAAGANAGHLLAEQPPDFPYGIDSPLGRFVALNGKILLLGSDHDEVTFLHHLEHVVDFPNKKIASYQVPHATGHGVVWRQVQEVNTAGDGAHANWPDRFFAQLIDGYLASTGNQGGLVGSSRAYLIPADDLFKYAAPIMQRVASTLYSPHSLRAAPRGRQEP
jgi:aminoglycoside 3-N-acetyltransferase